MVSAVTKFGESDRGDAQFIGSEPLKSLQHNRRFLPNHKDTNVCIEEIFQAQLLAQSFAILARRLCTILHEIVRELFQAGRHHFPRIGVARDQEQRSPDALHRNFVPFQMKLVRKTDDLAAILGNHLSRTHAIALHRRVNARVSHDLAKLLKTILKDSLNCVKKAEAFRLRLTHHVPIRAHPQNHPQQDCYR